MAFTAQGLGDMCGSLVWSLPHVATRLLSAHHYMTAALCIFVAGMATVGAAFASSLPVFVACSFLQGLFIGRSTDTGYHYVSPLDFPLSLPSALGLTTHLPCPSCA